MTRKNGQITSADALNPAFPVIFGPVLQPATPKASRQENSRVNAGAAGAPNSDADAFFRANPDALLEGLLTETLAAFRGPASD